MSQPKDPSNETMLELMLQHSRYSHFKKQSEKGWRDPTKKNAGLSISVKGFKDFNTGEGGSLADLARKEGLTDLIDQAREIEGKNPKPKTILDAGTYKIQDNPEGKAEAAKLWKKPESEISKKQVIAYLTEQRKLPPESFEDLLGGYIRSVSDWYGNAVLLVPMIDTKQAQFAAAGSSFNVEKVQRIILKKDGKEKKQLGGGDSIGRLTYFPPLSANGESLQYLVIEGLENALTIRSEYPDHHFLLTHGKGNFKHVPEFLPKGAEVSIISDHDAHGDPKKNGETAAAELNQTLRSKHFLTSALMPAEPKQDANAALQEGTLDKWFRSLIAVPSLVVETPSDFDISSIKGEQIPVLPKGILDGQMEAYLQLAAESIDGLNYEAAFCEFLMNASVAIGGLKKIVIMGDWTEKACLWMASIGKSGLGKTPLNQKCGGAFLKKTQSGWMQEFDDAKKEWERAVKNAKEDRLDEPERPIRKVMYANPITMETLRHIHSENSAGLGLLSDEILSVLEGLNQYKGKGNDRQTVLSLWNCDSDETPTLNESRSIPSVFVPISGGIQEDLLRKIISDENARDGMAARFLFNHLIQSPNPVTVERFKEIGELLSGSQGRIILERTLGKLIRLRDQPNQVTMESNAEDLLLNFQHYLKREGRQSNDQVFAAYAKLQRYIFRVALLLHYLFEREPDSVDLSEDTANKTITVMMFFIANMKRAYGTIELNKKEVVARKILNKVAELGGHASVRAVKQPLRKSAKSSEFDSILKLLVETGELIQTEDGKAVQISLP